MDAKSLTKERWNQIVRVMDSWSGGLSRSLAHPIFFYELGEMARVVEEEEKLIGFLLGFISPQSPPVGYVHLVGVHPDHRRRGIGRFLYSGFEAECRVRGCKAAKAITTLGNEGSLRFHRAIGWDAHEVADYAGPGMPRIVFSKEL
ncbi:MAG: GNAT family N-acetyltransferase [Myxococcales bacterium]|nr:GNAT family N-acetyltransferase [Polyangiaceae bacterium]MDW8248780.1 GNAT family N-acetyltransferase [Myxococcales bacterium]